MNQEILNTIITNIRAAMDLRGMTEKDFCKAIGVSDRYLCQKRDDIGIVKLVLMCQTLKISVEDVLDKEYVTRARKEALKGEIERLTKELNKLEPFMPEPIEPTQVKK